MDHLQLTVKGYTPCRDASYALAHPKQIDFTQSNLNFLCYVLDASVRSLRPSMMDFAPCDRKLQRAIKLSLPKITIFLVIMPFTIS